MTKISIVTDSTADLDAGWAKRYNIRVVPAFVNFGAESFADDGVALTRPDFYSRLAAAPELPTTAAPPPGLTEQIFREALDEADHVVAISLAKTLSGIYDGMLLAARNIGEDKCTVIDSGSLSMGVGWQVLAAAEAAANGADLKTILSIIDDTRSRLKVYAAFDTFEYLRRGGRVSRLTAGVGSLLQIKPVVSLSGGNVDLLNRVRTFKKIYPEMAQLVTDQAPLERLAVMHTNARDRAEHLLGLVQHIAPPDQTVITEATTAIGTQIGPGAIGVALIRARS